MTKRVDSPFSIQVEFTVLFRERDMPGFLDMLRYDQATVLNWSRQGNSLFEVTLRSERFTPDRWSSFGIGTKEVI